MGRVLNEEGIPYVKNGSTIWDMPSVATVVSMMQALTNNSTTSLQPVLSIFTLDARVRRELERKLGSDASFFLTGGQVPDLDNAIELDVKFLQDVASRCKTWNEKLARGVLSLLIPEIIDSVYDWFSIHLNSSNLSATTMRSQAKRIRGAFEDVERILMALKGKLSQRLAILGRLQDKDQGPDAIRLCTLHSIKGLEFDTVFLIDATEPDDGSILLHEHAERRLFYASLTRAKEHFFRALQRNALTFYCRGGFADNPCAYGPLQQTSAVV